MAMGCIPGEEGGVRSTVWQGGEGNALGIVYKNAKVVQVMPVTVWYKWQAAAIWQVIHAEKWGRAKTSNKVTIQGGRRGAESGAVR